MDHKRGKHLWLPPQSVENMAGKAELSNEVQIFLNAMHSFIRNSNGDAFRPKKYSSVSFSSVRSSYKMQNLILLVLLRTQFYGHFQALVDCK